MEEVTLRFDEINYSFPFQFVHGTGDRHFLFGLENDLLKIQIKDFNESPFGAIKKEIFSQLILVGAAVVTSLLFTGIVFIVG